MSALSIPASSGYGVASLVKSGTIAAQQQNVIQASAKSPTNSVSLPKFSSPHIYIDPTSNQVVFESRDSETGKLTNQLPSTLQLRAYRLQQSLTPTSSVDITEKPIAASGKTVLAA